MKFAVKAMLPGMFLLSAAAYGTGVISLAASPAAMGANDFVTWGQLGVDGAMIADTFSATSSNLDSITGAFSTTTGMAVTVGGSTWGPASGAFADGDALIWSFDSGTNSGTGPLSISFPHRVWRGRGDSARRDGPVYGTDSALQRPDSPRHGIGDQRL